jgi:3-oxoacyl-[acyl-carrier-protein] synthase-3
MGLSKPSAVITAVGGYVPEYVLTNTELERMVETTSDWIEERTGILERHLVHGTMASSDMAAEAVKQLLAKRDLDPMEIDLVIVATVTPDYLFPATSNLVCDKAGLKRAWGFDLGAACSGFLFALATGAQFIESRRAKKVLVIGADTMSSIVNYEDRNTCILFGDGAAAVLLEPDEEGYGLIDYNHHVDGSGYQFLHQKAGGSKRPATIETVANREHYIFQEGKAVFKFAVKGMADAAAELLERNGLKGDDIEWLVPHQANKRIIDATRDRIGLRPDQVMLNIQRFGNTTAATIPLCLADFESKLRKGDNLVLAAFGGGFTWGAAWMRWGYDGPANAPGVVNDRVLAKVSANGLVH